MRLFTAIDIPADIRARLRALMDRLRPAAKLSWSPVDNMHVTTKFIGEWPEQKVPELKDALSLVPKPGTFEIAVRGLGWFPNAKNPRVFWAGIEVAEPLRKLAYDTESTLAAMGVPVEDRDFHPHLTLARRRDPVPLDKLRGILDALSPDSSEFGAFTATSFFLYLSANGRYTKLEEVPLAA
ncbi:MAG: RNA 2',3'-cyclic phosphodiesterase [Bryobacterales bacterium]|nr:RNA 2',3'-cyclic phosphodiesterase [Bryobacterales bacterium]MBV9401465.1 RNA 2',3'-cyclic phosphodiesterase [Bryobacterales bacterium]